MSLLDDLRHHERRLFGFRQDIAKAFPRKPNLHKAVHNLWGEAAQLLADEEHREANRKPRSPKAQRTGKKRQPRNITPIAAGDS